MLRTETEGRKQDLYLKFTAALAKSKHILHLGYAISIDFTVPQYSPLPKSLKVQKKKTTYLANWNFAAVSCQVIK